MRRVNLEPSPLPKFFTHAQWCEWLRNRGQLAPNHRGCVAATRCIATYANKGTGENWRTPRRSESPVSR